MLQLTSKREKPVVGLEIEAGSIAAVEVSQGASPQLRKAATAQLPDNAFHDGEVVDGEAVAASLRTLFAEQKLSKRVRLGIANQRVVVRTLRLPAIEDPKELDAAVRFQAQEQIPMPLDQAVIDHRVVGGVPADENSGAKVDVILVAARREMIDASLRPLRMAGLQPIGIDLSAFGMIRALDDGAGSAAGDDPATVADGGATLFCSVGESTNLAVARRHSCLFTRVAPAGVGSIASDLAAETGLSLEHARLWLDHVGLSAEPDQISGDPATVAATRAALVVGAATLQGEMRLSLDFYAAQDGAQAIERVVFSGPGSAIPGFAQAVESGFGVPFEVRCPPALAGLEPTEAARLALSYGLALEA